MRLTEATQMHALRAVQSFLDRHRNTFPDVATGGARRRLDDALARLEHHVAEQAHGMAEAAEPYAETFTAAGLPTISLHRR